MKTYKDSFIPFSRPSISQNEISQVNEVMLSGWLTTGSKSLEFEKAFSEYISEGEDKLESISVNSATAGLHLALEACGIGPGDEVITTTLTFTATAEVVRYLGAEVVLIDIDPVTMNIDTQKIRDRITKKTKAIIPVHYAGLSCNMNEILNIAKEFNLKVIEDAAHALPTTYNRKTIGSLKSDATVFSFYANKTITTGEGGMVVTRNMEIAKRVRLMRLHGIDRDAFNRFTDKKTSWYYEVIAPGYKYNLTDIAAGIGLEQLKKLPKFLKSRQSQASLYFEELKDLPLILPAQPKDDLHAWHLYVIRLSKGSEISRDSLISKLLERGIGTSVHYVPLHLHPYWKKRYKLKNEDFIEAQRAYEAMISIPLYPDLSELEQQYVIKHLREILLND
jgi:dTDP-4-amino-4,6-dideoxygalactose transaminase